MGRRFARVGLVALLAIAAPLSAARFVHEPWLMAQAPAAGGNSGALVAPTTMPAAVPLHTRDELALIVRQIDTGDVAAARTHWRDLLRVEAASGHLGSTQRYLDWVMAHAYRDELLAANKAVAVNRFYDALRGQLNQHRERMQQLRDQLGQGQMRVVRTISHVPEYRDADTPLPQPVFAPRQMDQAALTAYLAELDRQIKQLGRNAGLQRIDLPAALAQRAELAQRIEQITAQLRQDALMATSAGR